MVLIKCPVCGGTVSENAISCPHCGEPIKASHSFNETDSGTETFHVEAKNRLELSAKADAEVNYRTTRLSNEGKNVVNIQKSEPQPFTLGITIWKMDITLIWNANLNSERYKQTVYDQAITLLNNAQYAEALNQFNKIQDFRDSKERINLCNNRLATQKEIEADALKTSLEIEKNIGKEPNIVVSLFLYVILSLLLIFSLILMFNNGFSEELDYETGEYYINNSRFMTGLFGVLLCGGGIIWRRIYVINYEKRFKKYLNRNKLQKQPWLSEEYNEPSYFRYSVSEDTPDLTPAQIRLNRANELFANGEYASAEREYQSLLTYDYRSFDESTKKQIEERIEKCYEYLTPGHENS